MLGYEGLQVLLSELIRSDKLIFYHLLSFYWWDRPETGVVYWRSIRRARRGAVGSSNGRFLIIFCLARAYKVGFWLSIVVLMKNILCIGGSGALGSKVVSAFAKHRVFNVDFRPHPSAAHNILLQTQPTQLNNQLVAESVRGLSVKFDAILVTAGGFTMGSIKDEDYFEKTRQMNEVNLYPSMLAAHLATRHLLPGGLVVFTGAASVYQQPDPAIIAYALSKAGVHYLAKALAEKAQQYGCHVLTILPKVIDTQSNREAMPGEDFSQWAKPEQIAQLLVGWVQGLNVPHNGAFLQLSVKEGCLQHSLL